MPALCLKAIHEEGIRKTAFLLAVSVYGYLYFYRFRFMVFYAAPSNNAPKPPFPLKGQRPWVEGHLPDSVEFISLRKRRLFRGSTKGKLVVKAFHTRADIQHSNMPVQQGTEQGTQESTQLMLLMDQLECKGEVRIKQC